MVKIQKHMVTITVSRIELSSDLKNLIEYFEKLEKEFQDYQLKLKIERDF